MMAFSTNNMLLSMMLIWWCLLTLSESGPVYNPWSLSRIKRQQSACQDGTYDHDGRKCCSCAAGQRLKQHCTDRADTECELCVSGTYNDKPNHEPTCEPCTSCNHINANQELVEACTIYKDAVCQCKPGHYCDTDNGPCAFCHLTCDDCGGAENIRVACSESNNTVCYDEKPQGGVNVAAAVIVPMVIVLLAGGIAIGVLFYRRKNNKGNLTLHPDPDEGTEMEDLAEEVQPLKGVDLSRHLPDIAEEVGWKAMRDLALRSGITQPAIESHELNHPADAGERTLQLLTQWVEKQGTKASESLVQLLKEGGQNGKAEKVMEIMKKNAQPGNN